MMNTVYDKSDIKKYIIDIIAGKIRKLDFYREFTLEASKDIKKVPKYDSFREEIQEELFHLDRQMFTLKEMHQQMQKIINSPTVKIQLGSLVITNKARFYISTSLGEFFYKGDRFYAISVESPMAQIMLGKTFGDKFVLNNIAQTIIAVL